MAASRRRRREIPTTMRKTEPWWGEVGCDVVSDVVGDAVGGKVCVSGVVGVTASVCASVSVFVV